MATFAFLLCFTFVNAVLAKGSEPRVECTPEVMKVTIPMDGDRQMSYLDQMKDYKPCIPDMEGEVATYLLDLQDPHKCGVTRVLNKKTGKRTFYHKIVMEDVDGGRETLTVRCSLPPTKLRAISRRDVKPFPLDFDEPEVRANNAMMKKKKTLYILVLNITRYEEGKAPEPILGAVVKQNGKQVSGEISVSPGTPLTMEIFLNEESASVYGLLVNYMHVTDTGKQQETIILNGCSVDPYLFDNFLTTDGDTLTARFRAFKFPDTTYVQFKGTVTVCLDKCQGVQCTNGVLGYGRKRRSISSNESNKIYEVTMTTFIKVDYAKGESREPEDVLALLKKLKVANQRLGDLDSATVAEQTLDNTLVLHSPQELGNKASGLTYSFIILISLILTLLK